MPEAAHAAERRRTLADLFPVVTGALRHAKNAGEMVALLHCAQAAPAWNRRGIEPGNHALELRIRNTPKRDVSIHNAEMMMTTTPSNA